ncbi:MAG: carboxypeptidase-like regulatory domain-containing protein, partial [Gemmatimonadota bacterium]|nr:carboxypeptidase-like regulatory domain-containing protein [Gemmatimonadota bacterium]
MRPLVRMLAGLVLTLAAAPLAAQSGTIRGSVVDSGGTALSNAAITVEGTGLRTTTGADGGYEVRGVPAG